MSSKFTKTEAGTLIPVIGAESLVTVTYTGDVPKYDDFKRWLGGHFDEAFEHVSVLYNGGHRDMFVGETSSINGRHIRNVRATEIYRANALSQQPWLDPELIPAISGPAILFPHRRVWF